MKMHKKKTDLLEINVLISLSIFFLLITVIFSFGKDSIDLQEYLINEFPFYQITLNSVFFYKHN